MRAPDWLFRGPTVPVVLAIAAVAVVFATSRAPEEDGATGGDVPNELWRCHACAKAPDKGWMPCKTVTGRGNEKGARDRAKELACEEAGASLDECEIISLRCRKLDDGPGKGLAGGDEGEPSE